MSKENGSASKTVSIGVFFAVITFIGDGFQSIVSNSRPAAINSLVFSWITACIELVIIFPFFLHSIINRRKNSRSVDINNISPKQPMFSRKQIVLRLTFAGIIFAGCAYYLIVGFTLVDSVTGILAVKTQPISMMIIGAIFLKEKLSLQEILIGITMLVLIIFITTEGTFNLGNLSIGVIYLLIVPIFWNIGHSIAKPFLSNYILSVPEFVFIRIAFTSIILGFVFLIIGNKEDLIILSEKKALISIFSMGALFGILHTCWYQAVRALPLSIASLIVIPSPVVTAILTFFITHEPLFYYHYIGIFGEILGLSALILIQSKKKKINKKEISMEE